MAQCMITRIEEGKDQFTVLLEGMTQNDINSLCYALADSGDQGSPRAADLFEDINAERLKQSL